MTFQNNNGRDTREWLDKNRRRADEDRYESPFRSFLKFVSRNEKRIIRILGIAGIVISVYFLIGGVVCFSNNSTARDSDGYFLTWNVNIKKDSHAIVFMPNDTWIVGSNMGALKLEISNNDPSKQIFIGSGSPDKVKAYLDSVAYDTVTKFHLFPVYIGFNRVNGGAPASTPGSLDFWEQTASGSGVQKLEWSTQNDIAVVIMNADGSAGLDIHTRIWTSTAYNFLTGMGNTTIGVFLLLLSLFAYLYTRKSGNSVYPMPLEALLEEKLEKEKNKRK